jgi:hypothetical protein
MRQHRCDMCYRDVVFSPKSSFTYFSDGPWV